MRISSRPVRPAARRAARAGVIAPAVLLGLLSVGSPASAAVSPSGSQYFSTSGASATCYLVKTGPATARATCTLRDVAADGKSVYLQHQVMAFPSKRIDLNSGNGTSRTDNIYVQSDSYRYNWHVKVCRDVPYAPDNCSADAYFYVS